MVMGGKSVVARRTWQEDGVVGSTLQGSGCRPSPVLGLLTVRILEEYTIDSVESKIHGGHDKDTILMDETTCCDKLAIWTEREELVWIEQFSIEFMSYCSFVPSPVMTLCNSR